METVRRRLGKETVSERHACKALGQPRSTQRYKPRRPDMDHRLLEEMRRLVRIIAMVATAGLTTAMMCADAWAGMTWVG